jgi:hypothetical protein
MLRIRILLFSFIFTSVFTDNKSLRSHKIAEIKDFQIFLIVEWKDPDPDPAPDPDLEHCIYHTGYVP